MLLLQELSMEWPTQDDTTHTQNQWTAKGVMSLQPEQSGHTQLQRNQGENALKAIAQIHIQTQGGRTTNSSVELWSWWQVELLNLLQPSE